ncbi:MAG: hypothetical protein WBE89_15670, partial [Methyloceanibacter sp.]
PTPPFNSSQFIVDRLNALFRVVLDAVDRVGLNEKVAAGDTPGGCAPRFGSVPERTAKSPANDEGFCCQASKPVKAQ